MRKRTKAQQAELEALKKDYEAQKVKRNAHLEFQKKIFPKGVLFPDEDRTLHVLDIDMKQLEIDLQDKIIDDFATRLQANEDANTKRNKKAVKESNNTKTANAEARRKRIKKYIGNHPNSKPRQIIDALKLKVDVRQVSRDLSTIKNSDKR